MSKPYEVAVYYFPNYHLEPRNEEWHGEGWTEWNLVKAATPRFPGHQQPKVPLWGYQDEADPRVSEQQIAAAADHGITAFIYDWYWYEGKPFLQRALEEGFLNAANNDRLKFSLMWANHDWVNIFPLKRSTDITLLTPGPTPLESFVKATDYMIEKYFSHPSYWRLDGKLYFSIYDLGSLISGLGGVESTRAALDDFRERVRKAGLGELNLNVIVWGLQILPTEVKVLEPKKMVEELGFDTATSYVWVHHVELDGYPTVSYPEYAQKSFEYWDTLQSEHSLPYYPNVSMGWDSTPRTVQSDTLANIGYPYTPVLVDNTPEEFKKALLAVKDYLDRSSLPTPMFTVNSWNEWTEGSYLEPDTVNGMGYLEAIRDVFGPRP
ncbi:glycoside hydrolase family 99-like domain-containing protein [Cohnella soli]|uniref:Glycoside hydrolase family 99-like domain-containing protein n=1 Tax=Cohnella soli TaxID=425005 RepID=A0ABW0I4S4_9BACL